MHLNVCVEVAGGVVVCACRRGSSSNDTAVAKHGKFLVGSSFQGLEILLYFLTRVSGSKSIDHSMDQVREFQSSLGRAPGCQTGTHGLQGGSPLRPLHPSSVCSLHRLLPMRTQCATRSDGTTL